MDMFWICTECGSANPYPDSTECNVCGKEISQQEITAAEANYRTAVMNEENEKKEQQREELKHQREEEVRKRKAAFEEDQRRRQIEQEKKEKLKQEQQQKKVNETQKISNSINTFSKRYYKILKGFKTALNVSVVAGILVVLISVIVNNSAEPVLENIATVLETKAETLIQAHFEPFTPFENISDRAEEFIYHIKNSENINSLFEMLGW